MPLTRPARIALVLAAGVAVGALGTWLFLRSRGNALLQAAGDRWIGERIAGLTDSSYHASLHGLRYHPAVRTLRFDSVTVRTDVVRNQGRAQPLPTVHVTVRGGRITGVDPWDLVRARRLRLREVGYDGVTALVALPPVFRPESVPATAAVAPTDSAPAGRPSRGGLIAIGADRPAPPEGERTVLVERVRFANVSGTLSIPLADGVREIGLERLGVDLDSVAFDARRGAVTPFRAADARVRADAFDGLVDAFDRLSFEGLQLSVADSALAVRSLRLAPADGDSAFFARHPHRATRTLVSLDRLQASGVDWMGLLLGTNVAVRHVAVDGLLLDLLLDKRRPANPVRKRKPSPQQRLAAVRVPLAIDSVVLKGAAVHYAERVATSSVPGRLRFERIDGALTNLTNDPARQSDSTPARLAATARFMGRGHLEAVFEFPLLAPDYRARYHATLGQMPATALNEVLTPLVGAEVKDGELVRVRIDARVGNGVHVGRLVPEYRELHVALPPTARQRREEHGVGGFLKRVVRGAKEVAANTLVRDDNPAKPGQPPRAGRIRYANTPHDSFFSGLWKGLKPALAEVAVKVKL